MRVILISGKAQSGKDSTAFIMRELLEKQQKSLVIRFLKLLRSQKQLLMMTLINLLKISQMYSIRRLRQRLLMKLRGLIS